MEIGKQIISLILTQADLLISLSVASIGGLVILSAQIQIHNSSKKKQKIVLKRYR